MVYACLTRLNFPVERPGNDWVFGLSQNRLGSMLRDLCLQAGVRVFGFHAIRHHVASLLNDSGKGSVKPIQVALRHRRRSTPETHLPLVDDRVRQVPAGLVGER